MSYLSYLWLSLEIDSYLGLYMVISGYLYQVSSIMVKVKLERATYCYLKLFAKLSPSPSEAGLSMIYNHGGTATTTTKPPPPEHQKAHF